MPRAIVEPSIALVKCQVNIYQKILSKGLKFILFALNVRFVLSKLCDEKDSIGSAGEKQNAPHLVRCAMCAQTLPAVFREQNRCGSLEVA